MGKPHELQLTDWNEMVRAFHAESDRGAAVLAAGFVEHVLGLYLRAMCAVPSAADELFSPLGPLSSFSQRITIGYAFGLFHEEYYHDLTCIRRIRNHFAHHPLETTFATTEVAKHAKNLSTYQMAMDSSDVKDERQWNRDSYLFACAMFVVGATQKMAEREKAAAKPKQTAKKNT